MVLLHLGDDHVGGIVARPVEVCLVIADTCREKSAGEGIGAELEASEVLSLLLSGAEPWEATEALRDVAGVALGDEGASRSGSGAVGSLRWAGGC